jgi:hypothetical protein
MSRPQASNTFVPSPPNAGLPAAASSSKKAARERVPFVAVPASVLMDDGEKLEPKWWLAIDAATD